MVSNAPFKLMQRRALRFRTTSPHATACNIGLIGSSFSLDWFWDIFFELKCESYHTVFSRGCAGTGHISG